MLAEALLRRPSCSQNRSRLANKECYRQKGNDEYDNTHADLRISPPEVVDQQSCQLGNENAAETNSSLDNPQRQSAFFIEPLGDDF